MASNDIAQAHDSLLQGWSRKALLQRLLLPQDFMESVSPSGEEALTCHKTTNEYLVMSDREEKKTFKTREARSYSTDLSYRPKEFKNETRKIFSDAREIQCDKCRGKRKLPCDKKQKCSACDGKGRREKTMSGTHTSSTPDRVVTSGAGRFSSTTTISGSSSSRTYEYKVPVTCDKCSGRGQVTCTKCRGEGWVFCDRCSGAGVLVTGKMITRRFTYSKELEYQLSGLAENEFKNGLAGRHFNSVVGDLVSSEFQTPKNRETVLERQSVHAYDVLSRQYAYKEKQFYLNLITSSGDMRYVASSLPFSKLRVAAATALSSGVVVGVIAMLTFMT